MGLKGKSPKTVVKRLKVLLWGESGAGKSFSCCQFPNAYFIDCEAGSENEQYTSALIDSGSAYLQVTTHEEVMSELRSLLTVDHDFRTVVIDPISGLYHGLLDKFKRPEGEKGAFSEEYQKAATQTRRMINLVFALDMNVVITAHAKTKWARSEGTLVDLGLTFNAWKDMDYAFDLVLQLYVHGDRITRMAKVRKSRIDAFPFGEEFTFTYGEIAKRFGGDMFAKAKVEKPATDEQVKQLETMLASGVKLADGAESLWKTKAGVNEWSEMTHHQITKCIEAVQKKIGVSK